MLQLIICELDLSHCQSLPLLQLSLKVYLSLKVFFVIDSVSLIASLSSFIVFCYSIHESFTPSEKDKSYGIKSVHFVGKMYLSNHPFSKGNDEGKSSFQSNDLEVLKLYIIAQF